MSVFWPKCFLSSFKKAWLFFFWLCQTRLRKIIFHEQLYWNEKKLLLLPGFHQQFLLWTSHQKNVWQLQILNSQNQNRTKEVFSRQSTKGSCCKFWGFTTLIPKKNKSVEASQTFLSHAEFFFRFQAQKKVAFPFCVLYFGVVCS